MTTATTLVEVTYHSGEEYLVRMGDHGVPTDRPGDVPPSPEDLLIGSMAACIAFYVGRFLDLRGVVRDGLGVTAEYWTVDDPLSRIAGVRFTVRLPARLSEPRRAELLAVLRRCTVHNTLRRALEIVIELNEVES